MLLLRAVTLLLLLLGRGGMDNRAATVSAIRTLVVAAAVSLEARGRTSAAVAGLVTQVDIAGMLHTRRVSTGTRPRSVTQATGPNSCLAMRN